MRELIGMQVLTLAMMVWLIWVLIEFGQTQNGTFDQEKPQEPSTCQALECQPVSPEGKRNKGRRGNRTPRTKTPEDCPHCCEGHAEAGEADCSNAVIPYPQLKSKRGQPKRSLTEGYCCHNPECDYRGLRGSGIHALVADGDKATGQGLVKQIKCQWCGSKFLVTRDTAMYCSKLSVERVGEINRGLAEGLSISACARVFDHSRRTIHRLVQVSGDHFQSLHEMLLQGIHGVHVQMDELVRS